ncbi:uncharacterized protein LOC100427951 [Macaca mulatta]
MVPAPPPCGPRPGPRSHKLPRECFPASGPGSPALCAPALRRPRRGRWRRAGDPRPSAHLKLSAASDWRAQRGPGEGRGLRHWPRAPRAVARRWRAGTPPGSGYSEAQTGASTRPPLGVEPDGGHWQPPGPWRAPRLPKTRSLDTWPPPDLVGPWSQLRAFFPALLSALAWVHVCLAEHGGSTLLSAHAERRPGRFARRRQRTEDRGVSQALPAPGSPGRSRGGFCPRGQSSAGRTLSALGRPRIFRFTQGPLQTVGRNKVDTKHMHKLDFFQNVLQQNYPPDRHQPVGHSAA